jgi:WD40 repeat protein
MTINEASERQSFEYDAFISYSHTEHDHIVAAFHSALHRLAKPIFRMRALRVFRDKTNLAATPTLWPAIEKALQASASFLLVACPATAKSPWVQREVRWWLENRSLERLFIVALDGELVWSPHGNDYDWERTNSLPIVMKGRFQDEPLHVDLRWAKRAEPLSLRNPRFQAAVLDIASPLHGRPKDELAGEEVRFRRTLRTAAWAAVSMMIVLTIASVVASIRAMTNARRATERQNEAISRQLAAESRALVQSSPALLERSVLLAIEALLHWHTLQGNQALLDALVLLRRPLASVPLTTDATGEAETSLGQNKQGEFLLAIQTEGGIQIWNLNQRIQTTRIASRSRVTKLAFSGDAELLAGVTEENSRQAAAGRVTVWDVVEGREVGSWESDRDTPLTASPNTVFALKRQGVLSVCAAGSGCRELPGGEGVSDAVFSPNGRYLAAILYYGYVRPTQAYGAKVWDVSTGRICLGDGQQITDEKITAVAFSDDSKRFAVGSQTGLVRTWDFVNRKEFPRRRDEDDIINRVRFRSDGYFLMTVPLDHRTVIQATGSLPYSIVADRLIRIWPLSPPVITKPWTITHPAPVTLAEYTSDGRYIISACADKVVRIWSTDNYVEVARLPHSAEVKQMLLSRDGSLLATVTRNAAFVWKLPARASPLDRSIGEHVAIDHTGRWLLSANHNYVWLFDLLRHREIAALSNGGQFDAGGYMNGTEIDAIGFSADSNVFATRTKRGSVRRWGTITTHEVSTGPDIIWADSISDGSSGPYSSGLIRICLWKVDEGSDGEPAQGDYSVITFSKGHRFVATKRDFNGDCNTSLHARLIASIDQPGQWLHMVFSPSERYLAIAADDNSARLFQTQRGTEVTRMSFESRVESVSVSADDLHMAVSVEHSIQIRSVSTGQQVALVRHPSWKADFIDQTLRYELDAAFSPDGKYLLTRSSEGVRVWLWQPKDLISEGCSRVTRNLTQAEWQQHLGSEPYRKTCAALP